MIFALSTSSHDGAPVPASSTNSTRGRGSSGSCSTSRRTTRSSRRRSAVGDGWVARLDRVDFPPGGVAHRHVHPGPGIRFLLHGELTIDRGDGAPRTYRAREPWYEGADDPVLATASTTEDTAFVRVLLLPHEWAGKRTIRYVDPADEDKPRLQRATVFSEEPLGP